jgi:flagellar secretion chaperone FliS
MNPQAAQNYLRTKVLTATPEQLQLMLYDGAITFAEQAKIALEKKDFQASFRTLTKAQAIIQELLSTLRHEVSPGLCGKLAALYNYAYKHLVKANVQHRVQDVDEALKILRFQRETWAMLMDKLGKAKAAAAAQKMDIPAPKPKMEASLCIQA